VEKYSRTELVTDDKMPHAHCMLDTQHYKCTLGICNNNCFSIARMVAQSVSMLRYMYIVFLI